MSQDEGNDIIIVSDLHLSAGYDPRTGTFSRNEDFFYDSAFVRFLDHLRDRAARENRTWRLVILGDLFDFLQVDLDSKGSRADEIKRSDRITLVKMDRIAQGHAEFFRGLGTFIADGTPVDIIPGNHDIEMIRPSAQEHFKRLLVRYSGRPEAADRISFFPWIYYIPGVLYAEHGQQYDEANSFATLLRPYQPRSPDDTDAIELPLGSYFVIYLFNYIEAIDPFADNVKPSTRYLMWALQNHPIVALATLTDHARLFVQILRHSSDLSRDEAAARKAEYREHVLRPYAATVGLSYDTVVAIDNLAAVPAMTSKLRQLQALILKPIAELLPMMGALMAIYGALRRMRRSARSFMLFAVGVLGLVWRERRQLRPATQAAGYLYRAASAIHERLQAENKGVPIYVFGHTHTPELFPLTEADQPPQYINSGTWTPIVPSTFELLATRERLTFVQITHDPDSGTPIGRLMLWNDAAARPEMLPLMTA